MNVQASVDPETSSVAHDDGGADVLAPIVRRSMFWTPERQARSAWLEHVPFAFWLVDALRPRRIVELGTYTGVSYSAMCQAVKTLGLATSCFAVDTWKGDQHAGFYEEELYRDFAAFHEQRYASFSRLIRATFDDALPYFEDGSIDLLHIDGLHTCEAVQHDYQSWSPKLSPNAVVLFHDTNVREDEFGVFKFWSEASAGKPHFGFLHGHGLGVLGHGDGFPDAVRFLFDANDDILPASSIRETFAVLGRAVRVLSERPGLDQALATHAGEAESLRQQLAARDRQLDETNRNLADHINAVGTLRGIVQTRDGELTAQKQGLAERAAEVGVLRQTLCLREGELAAARQGLAERTVELSARQQTLDTRESELAAARQALAGRAEAVRALKQTVSQRKDDIAAAKRGLVERSREIEALKQTLQARQGELAAVSHDLAARAGEIDALRREIEVGGTRIKHLDDTISALFASTSWRITAPLRATARLCGRPAGATAEKHARTVRALLAAESVPLPNTGFVPAHRDARKDFDHGSAISVFADHPPLVQQHSSPVGDDPSPSHDEADLADFDPAEYLEIHPDLKAAGVDPTQHYLQHGRAEGRLGRLPDLDQHPDFDPSRDTMLIVFHDGTRTGSPILGYNLALAFLKKYNVIALFLGRGPLLDRCAALGAVTIGPLPPVESVLTVLLGRLINAVPIKFAIVNSVPSYPALPVLARRFIPNITLTHEFASYIRPSAAFVYAALWSGNIVFSSRVTMENAWSWHPELRGKTFPVLAQGRCLLPGGDRIPGNEHHRDEGAQQLPSGAERIARVMPPRASARDTIVVLGAGSVEYRKGVDLFIDCAAQVRNQRPDLPIRFVWIGQGYAPETDYNYSAFLADQIIREGLEGRVFIIDFVEDLAPAYAAADIFLLSSRLDPLPNVTIDALHEGIPVVCFGSGNGLADILREHGLEDECVVGDMDETGMAAKIIALASNGELRRRVGSQSVLLAGKAFNMATYVASIEELVAQTARNAQREKRDVSTIMEAFAASPDYFSPPSGLNDIGLAIRAHVRSWAAGVQRRKLFPGFHPGIYLERHGVEETGTDPLADFLRNGRPHGPWLSQLITPADTPAPVPADLRIALHIHAYYLELLPEILDAISVNALRPHLLISVGSRARREQVDALLRDYKGGSIDIRVVPNRGRDLGPLLTEFKDRILDDYDIIGHFHTKRSADVHDQAAVTAWRRFLTENLLGGKAAMIDIIVGRMAADREIGMVFPDDPNVVGWKSNRPYAEPIARRMALGDLPEYHDFPVGSMFWASVTALHALFKLDLKWPDYPEEPLAYDGSVLHGIERLLAPVATAAGKKIAMTYVPGVSR